MITISWKSVPIVPEHDEMFIHYLRDGKVIFFSSTRCWIQHYCTGCGNPLRAGEACAKCATAPDNKRRSEETERDAAQQMFESVFGPESAGHPWSVHPP